MPHPPPPVAPEIYSDFISLISATPPQILELDILPSSYPPEIHSDSLSVALPKPLLASLFLTARQVFLSYLSLQRTVCDQNEDNRKDQAGSKTKATSSNPSSYSAALDSTLVILLWDPNHLTAANFRKNYLLSLHICRSTSLENNGVLLEALTAEFHYLTSLLTSPLPKHTKSSTLWSHRLFLLRTFGPEIVQIHSLTGFSTNTTTPLELHSQTATLWIRELSIILTAGERHPRNYYAWNYARQLLDTLAGRDDVSPKTEKRAPETLGIEMRKCLVEDSVAAVQKWCFAHPRDISGWAFLAFLLQELHYDRTSITTARSATENEDAPKRVVAETKEFVRKFGWRGASVEWFLKAMGEQWE
ncbi:hypothetical protein MMC29_003119 [Sticta canariensis]|nr:hypothetical protein [Sticta canariensis]